MGFVGMSKFFCNFSHRGTLHQAKKYGKVETAIYCKQSTKIFYGGADFYGHHEI